jgi:hypothetical protein
MSKIEMIEAPEMQELVGRIEELLEARVVALVLSTPTGKVGITAPARYRKTVVEALERIARNPQLGWDDAEAE